MTRKEFGILRLLAARAGEVVTRDELLNEVWGYDNYPTTRTVDNHIVSLRAKLEDNSSEPRPGITARSRPMARCALTICGGRRASSNAPINWAWSSFWVCFIQGKMNG
jgi:hypothetical protein